MLMRLSSICQVKVTLQLILQTVFRRLTRGQTPCYQVFLSDGSKQSNQLISVFPEKTQRVDPNSLSSTEYPEPEKMLLASTFDFNLPNGSGRVIAEKGVSQSPKNIGPISNLSGNKDYSMDSSMILNNSKTHDQMTSLFSKESQLGNSNCFSSSICPEPEKMLLASSLDVNFPNDSGRVIAEKGVSQSAKNISPFSNLSGNKDYSINSSKILNNSKTHDQMTSLFSKESQLGNSNCFSSLRCPEPEKVLFASSCDVNQSNYQGQIAAVKGVSESAESINQSSSLSGKKRPLTDNSTVLQNSNSLRRSSLPRAKKSTPYMLDDDDLLASILVGRAPTLRMGPTPPLPKAASRKRPRLTPRVGVPKRKVLIDDTMVLHADAIRKQLVNIEDIRRLRKKAPCTRPEIWMIQKNLMEEELFSESLFTGISTELNDLYTRRYDMNDNINSPIVDHHVSEFDLYVESSKEQRPRMEFVSRSSERETGDHTTAMPDRLDNGVLGSSGAPVSIPTDSGKEAVEPPVQDKLGHHVSQLEPSSNNQTITMSTGIVHERAGVESSIIRASHFGNELEVSTVSRIEKEFVPKKIEVTAVVQEQELLHDSFQHFDRPREMADRMMNFVGAAVNDVTSADDEARCRIIDTKMQEPPGTFVSVEVPKCTEAARFDVASAGDEARCRIIDTEMQEPPGTSISAEVPKCTETPGLEVQEKFEHTISQLGPSSNSQTIAVSTGNVCETMVDLSFISSSRSGPEFAISTISTCEEEGKNTLHEPSSNNRIIAVSTGNVCGTVVVQPFISSRCSGPELAISTVATSEEEAKNTLPEPSSNNQTIAVSTGNVCETVVVQPLISSSRSGPELAISTVSKNTPHELSSNNQTIAVSTGNVRETVVVQPLISSPCFGPEIAISTVSTCEEEAKNTLHEASSDNQTIAVSTGNICETVADLPLISGHELAISTVSTREEVKNTLHEPELIHDLPWPSERPIEMFDRPSKFDGTAVDNVPTTEYIDRGNFIRTGEASITDDASFSQKDGRMDSVDLSGPQYGHIVGEIENGEILVSMLDKCLFEDGAGLPADSPNVSKHANDPIPETAGKIDEPAEVATISGFHAMEEIENELAVAVRGEHVMMKMDEPTSEVFRSENPQAVNPFLHQHNTETENVLSAVGDNSGLLECIVEGSLDGESAPMDTGAARESGQLNNGVEVNLLDNDTAFLNADYEADFGEAADNDIPDSEASLENSGWSTRTRGVARFLKTLFDAEHGRGKKIVPVDHLLAGKTRKEASRMFFETLVLKTRDYIHVEQEVPFESIKIKPRPKLLKSEF